MLYFTRTAAIITMLVSMGISSHAFARGSAYPLTRCGPDLASLCRIHGYFDGAPFHYSLAIYPGCIKRVAVETPLGLEYRRAVVCGAPDRTMVWW